MKPLDIAAQPGAFLAVKRPLPVTVEFAEQDNMLDTREGTVRYQAGDAILTGVEGERWPVPRARFFASYDPTASLHAGENGSYVKRHKTVWAWRSSTAIEIALSGQRGTLRANAGDVIIDYGGGDMAVVAPSIFESSYQRVEAPQSPASEDT
jgi:hypothetical protein